MAWAASWRTTVPPPVVLVLAAGLAVGLAPKGAWAPGLWALNHGIALLLFAVAAGWMVAALVAMHKQRTTVNPMQPGQAQQLVERGVFAFSRNPIYLADAALLVAWWCWLGVAEAGAGVLLFWVWIDRVQIPAEEGALAHKFGDAYTQYCARVRRWL